MEELIKQNLRTNEDIHIESIHSGWDHYIYIVNQTYVIRIPKQAKILAKMKSEMQLLTLLSRQTPIIDIPEFHLFCDQDNTVIGTYYPLIEGQALSKFPSIPSLNEANRLGRFLSQLHQISIHQAKAFNIEEVHNHLYWEQLHNRLQQDIYPFLTFAEKKVITKLFLNVANFKSEKVIIHGDLTTANILYHPEEKTISGVIDFTDTQIGDPAFDFAGLYWHFGEAFTKAALASYPLPFQKEAMYMRITSFYGLQPIFHEWLKIVNEQDEQLVRQSVQRGFAKINALQATQET